MRLNQSPKRSAFTVLLRPSSGESMKRKYGAALARETIAEQHMRERAKEAGNNRDNFGSLSRKGAVSRGKLRGRAYRAGRRK